MNKWFFVRSYFLSRPVGRLLAKDKWSRNAYLLEERVLLVKAASDLQAIKKVKAEARRYTARPTVNPYGQKVVTKLLGISECYEPFEDKLKDGVEVYSNTEVFLKKPTFKEIKKREVGRSIKNDRKIRRNFLLREFNRKLY